MKKFLSKVIKIDSNVYNFQGKTLYHLNRYEEAIECYNKAIQIDSDDIIAYNFKGKSLYHLNRYEEAIECYNKAIQIDPDYSSPYYNKGLSLSSLNRYEEAIECYNKAVQINSNDFDTYGYKGNALKDLNRYEEAIECYNKAIEINPDYTNAYNNKGLALSDLNRKEEAIECFNKAIEINANYFKAYNNKGKALYDLNRKEEAIECYNKAIEINSKYFNTYNNKGLSLYDLKRRDEAIECFNKANELNSNPTSFFGYFHKGLSLTYLQRDEEALVFYDKSIQLNPSYPRSYFYKGVSLLNLNRVEESLEAINQSINLDCNFGEAYLKKSHILKNLNQFEEFGVCYTKAIELNPYLIARESLKSYFEDKKSSSNLESKSGDDNIENETASSLINWFIHIASLPEDKSRQYALQLYNEGIYSSNILNMCLKSKYLTNNHLTKMNIPLRLQNFMLSFEPPTFEVNHEIKDLTKWLIYCLGDISENLINEIIKVLDNKHIYSLKMLQNELNLTIEELMSENTIINEFIGTIIIETLKFERESTQLKQNQFQSPLSSPTKPPKPPKQLKLSSSSSSIYTCYNHPIEVDPVPISGRVLKGKVVRFNKTDSVIIKIYDNKEELEKELSMISRLSTGSESHVTVVLDYSFHPKNYLVMEEFGVSLCYFYSKNLKTDFQLEISKQIIIAVQWLHRNNIVHCDLKPDNILVRDDGGGFVTVKLCDFDSATVEGEDFPSGIGENGMKVLKFTKLWVSPEVYLHNHQLLQNQQINKNLKVKKEMDIFCVGLILICLFNQERSLTITLLPNDDDELFQALTNPEYLRNKIISIPLLSSIIHNNLISICSLTPESRCNLSNLLKSITENTRTQLQSTVGNQKEIITRQDYVITEIGTKVDIIESKVDSIIIKLDTEFSSLHQSLNSTFQSISSIVVQDSDLKNELISIQSQLNEKILPSLSNITTREDIESLLNKFTNVFDENLSLHNSNVLEALDRVTHEIQSTKSTTLQPDETKHLITQLTKEVNSLTNNVNTLINTTQQIEFNQKNIQFAIFDLEKQVALNNSCKEEKIQSIQSLNELILNGLNEIKSQVNSQSPSSSSINEEKLVQLLFECKNDCERKGFETINQTLQDFMTLINNSHGSQQSSVVSESVTSALALISNQLNNLTNDMSIVHEEVLNLKREAEFHRNALKSIITGESKAPALFLVVPDAPIAKLDKFKSLFMERFRLYCICPVTLLPASSGIDKKGYLISNPRGWLIKLAPIIQLSLCVLKVALTAYGIPFPIPHFVGSMLTNELRLEVLDKVSSIVTDCVKDSGDDLLSESIENIEDCLTNLTNPESSAVTIRKNTKALQDETHQLYSEELHHLLFELEKPKNVSYNSDWKPQYTGLNYEIGGDGTSAWVSEEGKERFLREGSAALK